MLPEEKENKLKDINAIKFGGNLSEIVSSMDILLMMFEFNDDPEIISACKTRLQEGVNLLKDKNYKEAENFKV